MKRIVIIGCLGAGKTVFADRLSRITGSKLYSLDTLFLATGAKEMDRGEWRKLQEQITSGESWIVEGNYGATIDIRLKRADCVIFMDFSTPRCFLGFLQRLVKAKLGREKGPGIVAGCNATLDRNLLKYAWTFNRKHRNGIIKGLGRYRHLRVLTLKSRKEGENLLRKMDKKVYSFQRLPGLSSFWC